MTGEPLLIPGPAGLWLLAYTLRHGVQPTLYNFPSVPEALAFCARQRERPNIEVAGALLTPREAALLLAVAAGAPNLGNAAREAGTAGKAGRVAVARLVAAGLVECARIDDHKGKATVSVTAAGRDAAARMRPA